MEFEYAGMALIPIIVGLCEVVKWLGFNEKFIPLLSIILGVAGGCFILNPGDLNIGLIQGLVMGLTAVGLYSAPKNVFEGMVE